MDSVEIPPTTSRQGVFEVRRSGSVGSRSSSIREVRIQEELNFRLSRSSSRAPSLWSLSAEEEDELEGKSGDSGKSRALEFEVISNTDADFSTERLSNSVPGDLGSNIKMSSGALVLPVTSSPPPGRGQPPSRNFHSSLEFLSVLAHLTVFGILGVIIRYLSEILFGPKLAKVTSNNTALFIDLPANMIGSFFMGWCGVVFKKDIAKFSEHLALGLSTGLMGSITTYAAMIQRMLVIMVKGHWVVGLFGLLIGLQIAQMSLLAGVDSANFLLWIIEYVNKKRGHQNMKKLEGCSPNNFQRRRISLVLSLFLGLGLWVASGVLTVMDRNPTSRRTLWVACLVAPPGVWTRWYLARLNGQGIGSKHHLRWLPLGTFLTNVLASSLEASLSTLQLALETYTATLLVSAINLGTLGCMSTVSTFVVEIQIMHQGKNTWRAYVYPLCTICTSLLIGILVYGVPVWSHRVHIV